MSAEVALREACQDVGLDAQGATLIRLGTNAVFRLGTSRVVARVARSADQVRKAKREIDVSRWLVASAVPAVIALDVDQPVVTSGRVVTFWEAASDDIAYGTTGELAALLRRLHDLDEPTNLVLPVLAPFDRAWDRLDHARAIPDHDRTFLADRCQQLAKDYEALEFALPGGVVHGDASVGNVIRDDRGLPLFADLDGFAIGPREWDLVLTALYYENFGWHTDAEFASFVDGYGPDVRSWSGYPVLRDVRELLMVIWLAQNVGADPRAGAEFDNRMATVRNGESRRSWKPF